MLLRMSDLKSRSWAGAGFLIGTVALLCVPTVRAQETKIEGRGPQDQAKVEARETDRPARADDEDKGEDSGTPDARSTRPGGRLGGAGFLQNYHAYALNKEREEVEILEAQLASKQAHTRLAEARLKQAQDQLAFFKQKGGNDPADQERIAMLQAEIPVLEAERDTENAEMREPQILLDHARRWLKFFEDLGQQRGPAGRLGRGMGMGMGMGLGMGMGRGGDADLGHMGWEHMGMDPFGMGSMGFGLHEELSQLRSAIEDLQRQFQDHKHGPDRP